MPIITTPTTASLLPTATPTAQAIGDGTSLSYVVKEGDTLLAVAVEIGIDVDAVGCLLSPTFDAHQPLVIGTKLDALPANVLCHHTQPGDTVQAIANLYGTNQVSILTDSWNAFSVNQSSMATIPAGRYVHVPLAETPCQVHDPTCNGQTLQLPIPQPNPSSDAALPWLLNQEINSSPLAMLGRGGPYPRPATDNVPANWPYGSGVFRWPLSGWLTQGYRYDHRAIDIAANWGTPVAAADRGVVIRSGWNNQGYGLFVVIDHNIDYVTLYAHLSRTFVEEGDIVAKGQLIGAVGSTGNSTGPHLHFEIRDFGRLINPISLLSQN
ncbi:MAG: M23 family metallopeptidase [Caldilineaceae bacterium]